VGDQPKPAVTDFEPGIRGKMPNQLDKAEAQVVDHYKELIPGHLIRRAQQITSSLWADHVGSTLTSPQYAVMATLYRVPAMDQVSITQIASLDRSTLADVLARLESRSLITRSRDKLDARRNLVSLTQQGRDLVESVGPEVAAADVELVECFESGEREEFLHQLVRLVKYGEARMAERAANRAALAAQAPA
jgi:MarR family transcriptional regulator, lower aerobic nicotinate degradation pathway regulator